jgi:Trypsin-like peptidase domain
MKIQSRLSFLGLSALMLTIVAPLFPSRVAAAGSPLSPVVQVRTYDVIHGKYPQAIWQGSASIISQWGLLLTNNHVAVDKSENNAAGYVICMTMQAGQEPVCDYTAKLVARDENMDIALLQLDVKDLAGKTVDFASLPVMDIDYTYTVKDKDPVSAIGYPGIGWDTMTTTNGTVGGTNEYNGFTYIKTDTTIAPGNSWGPMVSSAGKLIGVNTFGASTDGEGLGYALLISEAKEFITSHLASKPLPATYDVDLSSYAKHIDTINKTKTLDLPWITYTIPAHYKIDNLIADSVFSQKPKDQRDIQAAFFGATTVSTPVLNSDKKFFYYLEVVGIYSKDRYKLNPITIGGKKFYQLVDKDDATNGEGRLSIYVGQINDHVLAQIIVFISGVTEKKLEEGKAEKKSILDGIVIKTAPTYSPSSDGTIVDPSVIFAHPALWVGDVYGDLSFGGSTITSVSLFQGNMHDSIELSIEESTNATSIDKIFQSDYKDYDKQYKAKAKFQWRDAIIVCREKHGGWWNDIATDENNKKLDQSSCRIVVLLPGLRGTTYQMTINIVWPRSSKEVFIDKALKILDKEIVVGNGKTTLPNLFKKSAPLSFTDLKDQPESFKRMVKLLLRYKLVKDGATFNPTAPVTYGLLAEKYLSWVHNIDIRNASCTDSACMMKAKTVMVNGGEIDLQTLFSPVVIDWKAYVDESKLWDFLFYLDVRLAGVDLESYTENDLETARDNKGNPDYDGIYQKLDAYYAQLHGVKIIDYKTAMGEWSSWNTVEPGLPNYFSLNAYSARVVPLYIPGKWIVMNHKYDIKKISFENPAKSIITTKERNNYDLCITKYSAFDCLYGGNSFENVGVFTVLSKGEMVDYLTQMADFGFFDPELAAKKEAEVGTTDTLP